MTRRPATCVATILRPGKTPDGKEVRAHLRRLVRRIRQHWPDTRITIRGDSHYGRREAMDWCGSRTASGYIFGLSTNAVPRRSGLCQDGYPAVCVRRAVGEASMWCATTSRPATPRKSWRHARRVVARIEATTRKGLDVRYVVTNITHEYPRRWLYDGLYCARGQAENLIKRHKSQLGLRPDQLPLAARQPDAADHLHTAAYWLMRTVRDTIPKPQPLASGADSPPSSCGC